MAMLWIISSRSCWLLVLTLPLPLVMLNAAAAAAVGQWKQPNSEFRTRIQIRIQNQSQIRTGIPLSSRWRSKLKCQIVFICVIKLAQRKGVLQGGSCPGPTKPPQRRLWKRLGVQSKWVELLGTNYPALIAMWRGRKAGLWVHKCLYSGELTDKNSLCYLNIFVVLVGILLYRNYHYNNAETIRYLLHSCTYHSKIVYFCR